jgi:hypothetical protein
MDLAAAGGIANKIVVYWSDGADSITWTQQDVETGFTGARSVWIDDIDRDGDLDIAGICWQSDVAWWSNDGGDPVVWTRQTISTTADGGHAVCIADINGDGRPDVLGACYNNHKIAWWENGGGSPIVWTEHVLNGSYTGAITVRAGDLDQDGALDPVGAAYDAGEFSWWEATGFESIGELTSSIFDGGAGLGRMDWSSSDPVGTDLSFQVRSSNDPGDLGSWSAAITGPGSLPGVLDRYFQYKVLFGTTNPDYSAVLFDVTFGTDSSGVGALMRDIPVPDLDAQPNPFSSEIRVSFGLKLDGPVRLSVIDVLGRRVREIADTRLGTGRYRFTWDGTDDLGNRQSPGVYWLMLETANHKVTREVILLR